MPRIIMLSSLLLTLFIFQGLDLAEAQTVHRKVDEEPAIVGGSGSGKVPFSDDEDFGEYGSGSGSGQGDVTDWVDRQTTPKAITPMEGSTTTTTKAPLSDCEHLRQTNRMLGRDYIPLCEKDFYAATQCQERPGFSDCWCSDKFGKTIPGTVMYAPNIPECNDGSNLSPCLYNLVSAFRKEGYGIFKPRCTSEGLYHPVQCKGSMCYCVDQINGTEDTSVKKTNLPEEPKCKDDKDRKTPEITTPFEPTDFSEEETSEEEEEGLGEDVGTFPIEPVEGGSENENTWTDSSSSDDNVDVTNTSDEDEEEEKMTDDFGSEENRIDQGEDTIKSGRYHDKETKIKAASPIMAQPGLLAGIIGGSVVVVLCLVLLIMFVIYRMRKKDEGSYPLEEPRKPPKYPYMRAPEREYYA